MAPVSRLATRIGLAAAGIGLLVGVGSWPITATPLPPLLGEVQDLPGRANGGPDQQDGKRDNEGDGDMTPVETPPRAGFGKSRFTGHRRSVPYLQAASKAIVHGAGIDRVADLDRVTGPRRGGGIMPAPRARSSVDRAPDFGSGGRGFESLRARH